MKPTRSGYDPTPGTAARPVMTCLIRDHSMVMSWVHIGAIRCITRAFHPPNTKRSPRDLGSTCFNTFQMMHRQEGTRRGSVNGMSNGDVGAGTGLPERVRIGG